MDNQNQGVDKTKSIGNETECSSFFWGGDETCEPGKKDKKGKHGKDKKGDGKGKKSKNSCVVVRQINKRRKSNRCKKKSKRRKKKKSKCDGGRKCRGGKATSNPFLNFLRVFRSKHCGWKQSKLAVEGAKKWCSMTVRQRERFYRMACGLQGKCKKKRRKKKKKKCKSKRKRRRRKCGKRKRSRPKKGACGAKKPKKSPCG